MINSVALTGRLTRDVDLRYTQSGIAVGSFTLAVNRQFTTTKGERESDFINCVIWRKSAENFNNFTHKGSLVGIQGTIQTRSYENNQGQKVYVTEVAVDKFALLEPKGTTQSRPAGAQGTDGGQQGNHTQPGQFGGQAPTGAPAPDPFKNSGQPIDISDDDLPF